MLACIGSSLCLWGFIEVRRFAGGAGTDLASGTRCRPPVTILKPLCGDEPLLSEAIESSFRQDYPEFQIVFGIQNPEDPALAVLDAVRTRFPSRDVAIVIDSTLHGPNRKVSNLINMLPFAKHEVLVISDSDLHLPANYLDSLAAELEQPGAGLVTSLYIGLPPYPKGWAAFLGATQISHHFLPGVLMSRAMGREDCLGSTAMFRLGVLERVGGFHGLVHLLAEDNVLGQRIRDLGLSVRLAGVVPAATVAEPSFAPLWHHEVRWARTIRELAPWSLCASTMQYPIFWAVVAIIAGWTVRALCAGGIDRALNQRVGRPSRATPAWLHPLRDLVSVAQITACFWVEEVTWRGHRLGATGVAYATTEGVGVPFEPDPLLQEN